MLAEKLKNTAKYLLGAAVSYTIAFLLFECVKINPEETISIISLIMIIATDIAIVIAGGTLATGLVMLVNLIGVL
jgi:hypothetical protein